MTGWTRTAAGILAGFAIAMSLAISSGAGPVRGIDPLPLPTPTIDLCVPLPSIELCVPTPSLPLPTPSLPLPTIDLGTPLPTPSLPLPTIDLGSPSRSLGTPGPSSSTGPASPLSAPSDGPTSSPPSHEDDQGVPGGRGRGDGPSDSSSGGGATVNQVVPSVPETRPLPPSLPGIWSWLVPALGAAVPALLVAALVALEILGGAAGLRAVGVALDRVGSHVPPWLRSTSVRPEGTRAK